MSLARDDRYVTDAQGRALAGALVYWCLQPATVESTPPPSPLAGIFTDLTGDTPLAQPVVTDGFGHAYVYMNPGVLYTIAIYHPLFGVNPIVLPDQAIGEAGTQTYVTAGEGITLTGTGRQSNPYVISTYSPLIISSFTGGQSIELGQTVTNPAFSATYDETPIYATITNTEGTGSPLNLVSPFTSGTVIGSFSHTSLHTTTFTLAASDGTSVPTATQALTWNPRIFSGPGAAEATSSVTASGTTAVLSTTDVLPSAGLGAETVGQSFGPFTVSARVIYLLLTGGSHTFVDALTGFPFAFNSAIPVSFVNQYGVLVTLYLYQSANVLSGTFQPKVVS